MCRYAFIYMLCADPALFMVLPLPEQETFLIFAYRNKRVVNERYYVCKV